MIFRFNLFGYIINTRRDILKKSIYIDNMTCEHCSAKVQKALEEINSVDEVKVSLFRKKATVSGEDLNDEILKKAVTDAGYNVTSIE